MDNNPPLFDYVPPDVLKKGVESTRNYLRALAMARETLHLSLNDQEISVLSPSITDVTSLTSLRLDQNRITELPDHLFVMTALTSLSLKNNKVDHIPTGMLKLSNLTYLNLDGNPFARFPDEIVSAGKGQLFLYLPRVEESMESSALNLWSERVTSQLCAPYRLNCDSQVIFYKLQDALTHFSVL